MTILPDTYIVVHIGTTGYYDEDEIFSIGLLKVNKGIVTDKLKFIVNPGRDIPSEIQRRTGISNQMVAMQPDFSQVKLYVMDFIGSNTIVGHNTRYLLKYLNKHIHISNEVIDIINMCREINSKLEYKLFSLARYLNISTIQIHDITSICQVIADISVNMGKLKNCDYKDLYRQNSRLVYDKDKYHRLPNKLGNFISQFVYKKTLEDLNSMDRMKMAKIFEIETGYSFSEKLLEDIAIHIDYMIPKAYVKYFLKRDDCAPSKLSVHASDYGLIYHYKSNEERE